MINKPLKRDFWTLRKIILLLGFIFIGSVTSSFLWLSKSYNNFVSNTYSYATKEALNFLTIKYFERDYKRNTAEFLVKFAKDIHVINAVKDQNKSVLELISQTIITEAKSQQFDVKAIVFYDHNMKPLVRIDQARSVGWQQEVSQRILMLAEAKELPMDKRFPFVALWNNSSSIPLHSLFIPVGIEDFNGYVEMVADPFEKGFKGMAGLLHGQIHIVDPDRRVVFQDQGDILGPPPPMGVDPAQPPLPFDASSSSLPSTVGTSSSSTTHVSAYNEEDTEAHVFDTVSMEIPTYDGKTWATVLFTRDISDFIFAGVSQRNKVFLVLSGLLLVGTVAAWVLLIKFVFHKLRAISRTMLDISQGKVDVSIPSTGRDEVGTMADSLHILREAVRKVGENERQLRTILENSSAGVVIVRPSDHHILFANARAAEMYKVSKDQFYELSLEELFHVDDFNQCMETLENQKPLRDFEARARDYHGQNFWALVTLENIVFGDQHAYILWLYDIDERKKAEDALQVAKETADRAEARLLDAIEALPEAFVLWDANDQLIVCNRQHQRISASMEKFLVPGVKFEDIIRKTMSTGDILLPVGITAEEWIADRLRAHRTGGYNIEQRFPNGRWYRIVEHKTSEGGIVGLVVDITDIKRREEALRVSTQRLSLHISQTPIATVEWDLGFRITQWNPAAEKIFGYSAKEAVGRLATDLIFPPTIDQDIEEDFSKLLKHNDGMRRIYKNRTKDGQEITCEWYHTPLINPEKNVIAIASLGLDITERIAFENSLKQRISHDNLLNQISRQFIDSDTPTATEFAIEKIQEFLNCDRVYVYLSQADGKQYKLAYQHLQKKAPSPQEIIDAQMIVGIEWFWMRLERGEVVTMSSLEDLPEGMIPLYNKLLERGIKSFVIAPLLQDKKLVGFIGGDCLVRQQDWKDETVRFMKVIGELIALSLSRQEVENALNESRERFELAITGTRDGIFDINFTLDEVYVSPHWLSMLGLTDNDFEGHIIDFINLVHPDDRQKLQETWNKLTHQQSGGWEQEYRMKHKDGSTRWILSRAKMIQDADKKMIRAVGGHTDITYRKLIEEELTRKSSILELTLQSMYDGIVVVDSHGKLSVWNDHFIQLLRLNKDKIEQGINLQSLTKMMSKTFGLDKTEHNELVEPFHQAMHSKKPQYFERTIPGEDTTLECQMISMVDGGVLATFRDVTEVRRIEKLKNEFVSTVSHELRTPLTSIRGSLGLISGGAVGEINKQVKDLVQIASNSCDRLVLLINDILDIEKIESGKMDFNLQPMKIQDLIERAIQDNKAFAEQFSVQLEARHPKDIENIEVYVDANRMIQVLTNLLSNACKFSTPNTTVQINVEAPKPDWVRVSVVDHGPGIPMAFRNRIFQKFAQADSADNRKKGGTGLGLNIARKIVEKLGGSIHFKTKLGQGTTFYFDLPVWQGMPHRVDSTTTKDLDDQDHKPRILVCEDDPDMAKFLATSLQHQGYETDIALTATQAKDLLKQHTYSAMTLDIMLPDQNGLELLHDIRNEHTQHRHLPVIIVTAKDEDEKTIQGRALGIIDWLRKPLDSHELSQAIEKSIFSYLNIHQDRKLSILHIEDDESNRKVMQAILQEFAHVDFAVSVKAARQLLSEKTYDLILLDVILPDGSGLALLDDIPSTIPVVIFSAHEMDEKIRNNVAMALVKAKTSKADLLHAISSLAFHHWKEGQEKHEE